MGQDILDRHYSLLIDPDCRYCGGADYVLKIDDAVKVDYYMTKKSFYINWGKTSWTDTAAYS